MVLTNVHWGHGVWEMVCLGGKGVSQGVKVYPEEYRYT